MAASQRLALLWTAVALTGLGALYSLATLVHGVQPITSGPVQPIPWFLALAFFAICFVASLVAVVLAYRKVRQNGPVAN